MTSLIAETQLEVHRCWCGVEHAVPKTLADQQINAQNNGRPQMGIYCPLGHQWVRSGKSELQKLREQVARDQQAADQVMARLRDETAIAKSEADLSKRKASAAKGMVTRFKRLIKSGVCPCCRRPFSNLQRHMKTEHPDFDPEIYAEKVVNP